MSWGFVLLLGALGAAAGACARRLLARLRRGVRVRAGPCEAACALLCAIVALRWVGGELPGWWLPVPLVLAVCAVPLVAVDLLHRRLPDVLTAATFLLVMATLGAAALATGEAALVAHGVVGALAFAGVHAVVHLAAPGSMGAGDVKLAAGLGAVLGTVDWLALAVGACLAALVTLVLAALAAVLRYDPWRSGTPHGPGLLTATWLIATLAG